MLRLPHLLALLPLLPTPGCCSLARLFCGADHSDWVQVDYETPSATLRTFLEALRRENVARICESLGEGYKKSHGIDLVNAELAWAQIKQQNPYLYMAGYAQVPDAPTRQQDGRAVFDLEVQGQALHFELERQAYWLVHSLRPDGSVKEHSLGVPSLAPFLQLQEPDQDDMVRIRFTDPGTASAPPTYKLLPGFDEPALEQIVRFEVGQEWKISQLTGPRAD